jgi:starch phosphorylase
VDKVQPKPPAIAYFTMEVGLDDAIPCYAGGLGVLAGDSLRAASDIGIPLVGMTLLYRKGYFTQHLDASGNQTESEVTWNPAELLKPVETRVSITIEGRQVWIRPWRHDIPGISSTNAVIYFLDTDLPENSIWDRALTYYLYNGDDHYRICQEALLGLGGIAMLRALGYEDITTFHMNEGHSSFLTLGLLVEQAERSNRPISDNYNIERVRQQCVFTTHTPVPAGMDKFPMTLVRQVIGDHLADTLIKIKLALSDTLNMIMLALFFSRYINGVSMEHGEISIGMFPSYPINSISNGVHAVTWTSEPFQRLFDHHVPEWRDDNLYLRYIIGIPLPEIHKAHTEAKILLINWLKRKGINLDPTLMTIGFARRATQYKRANLLFTDLERLKNIARDSGPLQIIYAGKAHPQDEGGKEMIRHVFKAAEALKGFIKIVYLEDYGLTTAKYLCSGVDLWLNTPQKPFEASGTSGMKAALNGIPSLSILDGWWTEGHLEGVTGWSIGEPGIENNPVMEVNSMYDKLQNVITPLYYNQPQKFESIMRSTIAISGSYYNAQRMMMQYLEHAYMPLL